MEKEAEKEDAKNVEKEETKKERRQWRVEFLEFGARREQSSYGRGEKWERKGKKDLRETEAQGGEGLGNGCFYFSW